MNAGVLTWPFETLDEDIWVVCRAAFCENPLARSERCR